MKKEAQFLTKPLEKFDKQKVFLEQRRFNEKWSLIIFVRCTTSRNSTSSWLLSARIFKWRGKECEGMCLPEFHVWITWTQVILSLRWCPTPGKSSKYEGGNSWFLFPYPVVFHGLLESSLDLPNFSFFFFSFP